MVNHRVDASHGETRTEFARSEGIFPALSEPKVFPEEFQELRLREGHRVLELGSYSSIRFPLGLRRDTDMNRTAHGRHGAVHDASDEIHGVARMYGAAAAGGNGQDRLAGLGHGGRGGRGPRDGQWHRGGAAGIRGESSRRAS